MDFIKQWTLTVSTSLIISIVFSILTPKSNMGNFFKVILAMFIFISFIYPIKAADFEFELPEFNLTEYEDEQESTYENIVCNNVKSTLEEGGYLSCVVNTSVKCSDEEIEIEALNVGISDEFDTNEVKEYLFENLGLNAEVYYIGE